MGFLKTKEEKEKIKVMTRHRNKPQLKAFQEQNKKNRETRNLYRERSIEERRLRESTNSSD